MGRIKSFGKRTSLGLVRILGSRTWRDAADLLGANLEMNPCDSECRDFRGQLSQGPSPIRGTSAARICGSDRAFATGRARDDNADMPSIPQPELSERDIDTLQSLLDRVPSPLEPLDVSMLDGFLCGVLVQPKALPVSRWLPHVTDVDGRALPARFDATPLHTLVLRRHRELESAINQRQWFDPWVFELSDDTDAAVDEDDESAPSSQDAVYPWVAGFATALELFPALSQLNPDALTEPLALLYRHLDPQDLEDADALLEEIDSLEPPEDLSESVEGLVRATLLLADIGRPPGAAATRGAGRGVRRGPSRRR